MCSLVLTSVHCPHYYLSTSNSLNKLVKYLLVGKLDIISSCLVITLEISTCLHYQSPIFFNTFPSSWRTEESQDTLTPFSCPNLQACIFWLLCILILYIFPFTFLKTFSFWSNYRLTGSCKEMYREFPCTDNSISNILNLPIYNDTEFYKILITYFNFSCSKSTAQAPLFSVKK